MHYLKRILVHLWQVLNRPVVSVVLTYGIVFFLQLLIMYPFHRVLDLPVWDETIYMGNGAALLHNGGNLPPISWSPLYAIVYAPLIALVGEIDSIFLMKYVTSITVSLLILTFLIQNLHSYSLALFLTLLWCIADYNVDLISPHTIYSFALLFFLLALVTHHFSKLVALLFLMLTVFVRMEYIFIAVPYGIILFVLTLRAQRGIRFDLAMLTARPLLALIVGAQSILLLAMGITVPLAAGTGRTWSAFQQHYALDRYRMGFFNLDPWQAYVLLIDQDFPGSNSLLSALLTNPEAFSYHVLRNVMRMPAIIISLLVPHSTLNSPGLSLVLIVSAGIVLGGLLVSDSRLVGEALQQQINRLGGLNIIFLLVPLSLVPGMIVYARARYSVVLFPFLLLYSGVIWQVVIRQVAERYPAFVQQLVAGRVVARMPLYASVLLVLLVLSSPKPYEQQHGERVRYETIIMLQRLLPDSPVTLLSAGPQRYASYLGIDRVTPLEIRNVAQDNQHANERIRLQELIDEHQPDVIIVDDALRSSPGYNPDSVALLQANGWEHRRIGSEDAHIDIYINPSQDLPP